MAYTAVCHTVCTGTKNVAALPLPHPVVARVHKGAEEEELDGGLKAKHRLLGDHSC